MQRSPKCNEIERWPEKRPWVRSIVLVVSYICYNRTSSSMEYCVGIETTWDGDVITTHDPVQLTLSACPDGKHVIVKVNAPLFNDPQPPNTVPAGKPCPRLWDYEVAEIFFLGDDEKYLEVELCPHGQHLVLLLKGTRNIIKDQLPLEFFTNKSGKRWIGEAKIPLGYFPPNVTMMNAYAIHGSGDGRQYQALYPATKDFEEPDFHRLQFFRPIDLKFLPPNFLAEFGQSLYWNTNSE